MSEGFDAEIFVSLPKEEAPAADLLATHFEKKIAKWRDPHAQPLVRTRCSSWAVPWPGAKVCVGWKVESQPLYVDLVLQIDLEEPEDIEPAIAETLKEGTIISAISSVVSAAMATGLDGSQAARDSFVPLFRDSLTQRISKEILSIRLDAYSYWGEWE